MISLNLYIGNHKNISGIRDHIDIINNVLGSDFKIEINSNKLFLNGINLIIEEFSESFITEKLIEIKKRFPKTVYILFSTEFLSNTNKKSSFNECKQSTRYELYNNLELFLANT